MNISNTPLTSYVLEYIFNFMTVRRNYIIYLAKNVLEMKLLIRIFYSPLLVNNLN